MSIVREEPVPPLIAIHTERPETDAHYLNGVVFGPAPPPWTWENTSDEPIEIGWASYWTVESCEYRQPFPFVVVPQMIVTMNWSPMRTDGGPMERVPRPRRSGLVIPVDPIEEILGPQ